MLLYTWAVGLGKLTGVLAAGGGLYFFIQLTYFQVPEAMKRTRVYTGEEGGEKYSGFFPSPRVNVVGVSFIFFTYFPHNYYFI